MRPALPTAVLFTVAAGMLPGCIVVNKTSYADAEYAQHSTTTRKRIGVELGRVSESTASHLKIDRDRTTLVARVEEGSAAQRAGLQRLDIITGIDGSAWASPSFLREAVQAKPAGESVVLAIIRGGERLDVSVEVEPVNAGSIYN